MKYIGLLNWNEINLELNQKGFAVISELLSTEECEEIKQLYSKPIYRSVINMQRYRFGLGEYKYFNYPLPEIIQNLREEFYSKLAVVANQWSDALAIEAKYPATHSDFISLCNKQEQHRPTPLILHYQKGGFNTLHQDLYGEVYFPFQVVIALPQRGKDYEGGELVMTEQLPRAQSKANVLTPKSR